MLNQNRQDLMPDAQSASGCGLWSVIIGHGLFDTSQFLLFFFQGPPIGCITLIGRRFRGAPGDRALPSTESSAVHQARIELEINR